MRTDCFDRSRVRKSDEKLQVLFKAQIQGTYCQVWTNTALRSSSPDFNIEKNLSFYTLDEILTPKKIRHEGGESWSLVLVFFGHAENKPNPQIVNVSLTGLSHGKEVKQQFKIFKISWHFQKIVCSEPQIHHLKLIALNSQCVWLKGMQSKLSHRCSLSGIQLNSNTDWCIWKSII